MTQKQDGKKQTQDQAAKGQPEAKQPEQAKELSEEQLDKVAGGADSTVVSKYIGETEKNLQPF
jgi:hypothetical protein